MIGQAPEYTQGRFRALIYGPAGSGKTLTACSFPKPYIFDTEDGAVDAQYVDAIHENDGAVLRSSSFDLIQHDLASLRDTPNEFCTIVIDSITTIYQNMLAEEMEKNGADWGTYREIANQRLRGLIKNARAIDANLIVTAHSKPNWVRGDDGQSCQEGSTYDAHPGLDHVLDTVIRLDDEHMAHVVKSRKYELYERLEGQSCFIVEAYGRDELERPPESTDVKLRASRLLDILSGLFVRFPEIDQQAWLERAGVNSWSEAPDEILTKAITHLQSKLNTKESP